MMTLGEDFTHWLFKICCMTFPSLSKIIRSLYDSGYNLQLLVGSKQHDIEDSSEKIR